MERLTFKNEDVIYTQITCKWATPEKPNTASGPVCDAHATTKSGFDNAVSSAWEGKNNGSEPP